MESFSKRAKDHFKFFRITDVFVLKSKMFWAVCLRFIHTHSYLGSVNTVLFFLSSAYCQPCQQSISKRLC